MKKLFILFIIPFCMFSFPVLAFETFGTFLFNGNAPINIDGKLNDWKGMEIPEFGISKPLKCNIKLTLPENEKDFSASFRCFADKEYVYIAVRVIDDKIVLRSQTFGENWKDDNVTIYFDGDSKDTSKLHYDSNDGQLSIVGSSSSGVKYIDGNVPLYRSG